MAGASVGMTGFGASAPAVSSRGIRRLRRLRKIQARKFRPEQVSSQGEAKTLSAEPLPSTHSPLTSSGPKVH